MNLESLKMFCHVVDEGSITKAAKIGFVSQPAVTRQIHQLEELYGTHLFDRVDGKLKLSEAGKVLYPYAKEIIEYTQKSFDAVHELTGRAETILNVGTSLTIGEYLLPDILGNFSKIYPNIKFSITVKNTPEILSKLEHNDIDIALVEGAVSNKDLITEKFADDELVLIAPANHRWAKRERISIRELSEEKVLWRESDSGTRHIVEDALNKFGVLEHINHSMELGSTQSIKSAVEAELGISILPKLTVLRELKYGVLREVKIEDFQLLRDLWLVQRNHRFPKTGLNKFVEHIRGL
ncbi:LysR family transcriptional regulator [Robertmurraya sp. GLU-23]